MSNAENPSQHLQQCLVLGGLHKTQHVALGMKEHLVPVT